MAPTFGRYPPLHSRPRRGAVRLATWGFAAFSVLLFLGAPNALAISPLKPAFTAGCQGLATNTKIFSSSGTTSGGVYTYSNKNGKSHGGETASSSGSPSGIYAGAYYVVGPKPTGCTTTSTTLFGLHASWVWNLSYSPYLAANCTGGDRSNVTATAQVLTLGNVHFMSSPFYIFIPHRYSNPLPLDHAVACQNGGSSVYSPGWLGPYTVTIRSPSFTLYAGSYDFYTAFYANLTASATSGSSGFAAITVHAQLVSVSCAKCPP